VAKDGLKSEHDIRAGFPFLQIGGVLVDEWQHGLNHLLHEALGENVEGATGGVVALIVSLPCEQPSLRARQIG